MDVEKVDRLGNVYYESYSFCKDYSTWIYNLVSHNDYINDYSYKASQLPLLYPVSVMLISVVTQQDRDVGDVLKVQHHNNHLINHMINQIFNLQQIV